MFFQSHVPDFVDAEHAIPKQEFKSIDELLNHPWIKHWNDNHPNFQYYWDENNGEWSKAVLMCMFDNPKGKKEWWVLGYMDEIPTQLQKWSYPHDMRLRPGPDKFFSVGDKVSCNGLKGQVISKYGAQAQMQVEFENDEVLVFQEYGEQHDGSPLIKDM